MNPLLRNCWWSSESQKDFVGGSLGHGTSLIQQGVEHHRLHGHRKAFVTHGETCTSHSCVFSPLQLMFYLVQGVNSHCWMN